MNAHDFVFNQIYKQLLNNGVSERIAHNAALSGVDDYKKGKFKTPSELIERRVKEAKKLG